MEEWKQHTNGLWFSNLGNVLSKHKTKRESTSSTRAGGVTITRAVYELFIGEIPENHFVYHKDGNIENKEAENLFLGDRVYKGEHSKKNGVKFSVSDFIQRATITHGDRYDYSNSVFKGMSRRINIKCKIHGEFEQVCSDHIGGHGCKECFKEALRTWAPEHDKFLKENYREKGAYWCADELGKTDHAVRGRAAALGLGKKQRITHEHIPAYLWGSVCGRAKADGYDFDLDRDFLWELYQKQDGRCALSGWPIKFAQENKDNTCSIDRIDSNKGYTKDNVQLTHKIVNRCKLNCPEEFFYAICKSVAEYRQKDFNPIITTWSENSWLDTEIPVRTFKLEGKENNLENPLDSYNFLSRIGVKDKTS